jgi:hypothetical protein
MCSESSDGRKGSQKSISSCPPAHLTLTHMHASMHTGMATHTCTSISTEIHSICTLTLAHMHIYTSRCTHIYASAYTGMWTLTHSLCPSRVLTLRENSIELGSCQGVIYFNY